MQKSKGGYVFVSHSHKDIKKVRKIRNILEEQGFEPILFYLKSLDNKNIMKLEKLITDEIDAREIFVYVDSKNAEGSEWVRKELEYVKKNCVHKLHTIEKDEKNVSFFVQNLIRQMSVTEISESKNKKIINKLKNKLVKKDLRVLVLDENNENELDDVLNHSNESVYLFVVDEGFKNNEVLMGCLSSVLSLNGNVFVISNIPIESINKSIHNCLHTEKTISLNEMNFVFSKNFSDSDLEKLPDDIIKRIDTVSISLTITEIENRITDFISSFNRRNLLQDTFQRCGFMTPEPEYINRTIAGVYTCEYINLINLYINEIEKNDYSYDIIDKYILFFEKNNLYEKLFIPYYEWPNICKEYLRQYDYENNEYFSYLATVYCDYLNAVYNLPNPATLLINNVKKYNPTILPFVLDSFGQPQFRKENVPIPYLDFEYYRAYGEIYNGFFFSHDNISPDYSNQISRNELGRLYSIDFAIKERYKYIADTRNNKTELTDFLRKINPVYAKKEKDELDYFYYYAFKYLIDKKALKKRVVTTIIGIMNEYGFFNIKEAESEVRKLRYYLLNYTENKESALYISEKLMSYFNANH